MIQRQKKMGSSKDHFFYLRVTLPGSQKCIREYLRENEIFWGIAQGPRYYRFMQKTRHQKSHASVPLSTVAHTLEIGSPVSNTLRSFAFSSRTTP